MTRTSHPARLLSTALVFALTSLAAPTPAHADQEGEAGRVIQLRLNNPSSVAHPSYHGSITLKVNKSTLVEYRWGGSSCPAQMLSAQQIDMLAMAFVERSETKLTPMYTMGEGTGTRCMVGFTLVAG